MSRRAHRALLTGVDVDVRVRAACGSGSRRCTAAGSPTRRAGAAGAPALGRRTRSACRRRSTPAWMCAVADGRLPVSRCSSLRSSISLTGAFACCASFAQMMPCASGANLLPKPPPMYCVITRTFACGMLQRLREPLRALMHALRRDPRGQLVAVPLAHDAVRLEADVRDHVRRVGRLDDVRRLGEAGVEIAGLLRRRPARVLPLGKHRRRVRRHRLLDVRRECGSASYWTVTSRAASSARSSVSAATAATGSP